MQVYSLKYENRNKKWIHVSLSIYMYIYIYICIYNMRIFRRTARHPRYRAPELLLGATDYGKDSNAPQKRDAVEHANDMIGRRTTWKHESYVIDNWNWGKHGQVNTVTIRLTNMKHVHHPRTKRWTEVKYELLNIYIYMYTYIYIERERDLYIHTYIYIYRERERDIYVEKKNI